ncbi:hypothetical protein V9K67_02780 [Paraflavisolibacter sp. H34]|uniref:hypothetical protein n=1 Tax=Huijunlia imazamoxiresistens TaxID=3127457 RepID=UPI003015F39C
MRRTGLILLASLFFACNNEDGKPAAAAETGKENKQPDSVKAPAADTGEFPVAALPYRLSDTALLGDGRQDTIRGMAFSEMIPDSLSSEIFGKGGKVKYMPLAKVEGPDGGSFYIVKGENRRRKAAILVSLDQQQQFGAAFPFLVPDADASTTQAGTIDKTYSISRTVWRQQEDDKLEGKDVYAYNSKAKQFTLIMTDLLDDKDLELINPIDTLARSHKLAGDYVRDKKNIISVRDGRKPNLLTVFVHTEKGKTGCTGELKGDAQITSPTTALYRQAGDPCVLQFTFTASAVILKELEGCGARRGLECPFDGSFPRKKEGKETDEKKSKKVK